MADGDFIFYAVQAFLARPLQHTGLMSAFARIKRGAKSMFSCQFFLKGRTPAVVIGKELAK